MKIKDIFQKPISRNIDPVVKVDVIDTEKILNEVAEYVITQEISDKIGEFFSSYRSNSGDNGVWISGFYGSGKSHLLKILSFVLENKTLDGCPIGELFAEKVEEDNPMLKSEVLTTSKIPSESILFNIDSKSETKQEHMVEVFYNVFYDHLGYYGFRPHVAEFEMRLDGDGDFKKFKDLFSKKSGKSWEISRRDYFDPYVKKYLAESLGEIKGVDPSECKNVLEDYKRNQKYSIDDFCDLVQQYISKKGKGFRLNFFVDEVGQYISNKPKLMLNLQTIAESLASKTKGNSWIFVTSQEKLNDITGKMSVSDQNDFSRIQARFSVKITLTSANVDEMIEKRLLQKSEPSQKELKEIFSKQRDHLRTIYKFSDKGVQYSWYDNEIDFANKFPFVPYQFFLFKECLGTLSKYNYFQGKHSSVGERSMLIVFQNVIKKLGNSELDNLISYDKIFEGVQNWLKSENISSITLGEKNLGNTWSIRVLKVLFLVKYYKDFLSTKQNVSVLLTDVYLSDRSNHNKNIEQALNQLENENYIQRNGDLYEFLTDLETKIKTEINEEPIDEQEVNGFLKEIFFDGIIKDNKIRYEENKHEYKFTKKIDGADLSYREELCIEIITPNHPNYHQKNELARSTMGFSILVLLLPDNRNFIEDVKLYIKTKKYCKRITSDSIEPTKKRIIDDKEAYIEERKSDLLVLAKDLLSRSEVVINGEEVQDLNGTYDSKMKVIRAFDRLIKTVYTELKILGKTSYSETKIKEIISSEEPPIDIDISAPEREILGEIHRRKQQSDRRILYTLKEHFGKSPYGWYPNAVLCLVAQLYKRGKIEIIQDSNILDDSEVENVLLDSLNHGNINVEPTIEFDPSVIKKLKDIYYELFEESCPYSLPKDIATKFKEKLEALRKKVEELLDQSKNYPFSKLLKEVKEHLEILIERSNYRELIKKISEEGHQLVKYEKDLLDPIRKFFNPRYKEIYDKIRELLTDKDSLNLKYIEGDGVDKLQSLIKTEKPFLENFREAKIILESLKSKISKRAEVERELARNKVIDTLEEFKQRGNFLNLPISEQDKFLKPFNEVLEEIKSETLIALIENHISKFYDETYLELLNRLEELKEGGEPIEFINVDQIPVSYGGKRELWTHEEVDAYIEVLRNAYKKQITQNKRILL